MDNQPHVKGSPWLTVNSTEPFSRTDTWNKIVWEKMVSHFSEEHCVKYLIYYCNKLQFYFTLSSRRLILFLLVSQVWFPQIVVHRLWGLASVKCVSFICQLNWCAVSLFFGSPCASPFVPCPDMPQLKSAAFIEGLQREAERALREVLTPLHPQDKGRFSRILLTASTLKSINPNFVIELFFRPVIGPADLFELLVEMLFSC